MKRRWFRNGVIFALAGGTFWSQTTWAQLDSPHVQTVIDTIGELDPHTPAQLLRAVESLLNVAANEEARTYFLRLAERDLTDSQLNELYRHVGPEILIQISRQQSLAPEGTQFASKVLAAADAWSRDPDRLGGLLPLLVSDQIDVRTPALHSFAEGQQQAAVVLLRELATTESALDKARLRRVWRAIGRPALGPTLAGLYSANATVQFESLQALDALRLPESVPFLAGFAAQSTDARLRQIALSTVQGITGVTGSPIETREFLRSEIMARLADQVTRPGQMLPSSEDVRVVVWDWSDGELEPRSWQVSARTALLLQANRLGHHLAKMDAGYADLYAVTEFALWASTPTDPDASNWRTRYQQRFGQPPDARQLARILETAMKYGVPEAATVAAELLAQLDHDPAISRDPRVIDTLSRALRSTDPDLRAAAALALMHIDPPAPFRGAADLLQTALQLIRTTGQRRAMVIHPIASQGEHLASMLGAIGWQAEAFTRGKPAIDSLIHSMDYELILIGDEMFRPSYGELLQQLQFDFRTARVPVALFTTSRDVHVLDALQARWPGIMVIPFPPDAVALQQDLLQLGLAESPSSTNLRVERAKAALDWLGRIGAQRQARSFYDWVNYEVQIAGALAHPDLTIAAADTLGKLATPNAREALRSALRRLPDESPEAEAIRSALGESAGP